jgi:lysophospholipase L1-like esterase
MARHQIAKKSSGAPPRKRPLSRTLLMVAAASYTCVAVGYYYTREHRFDPFLQLAPPRLEHASSRTTGRVVRILTLGGSTTRGTNLPELDRYPVVLAALLQERYPSVRIEVFDGAMDWYTTKHSLIAYVTDYQDWQPDVVIVMHGINDLCRSFAPPAFAIGGYKDDWSHFYGPAIHGAKPPTFEGYLLRQILRNWYARVGARAVDYPVDRYQSLGPFDAHLRRLVRIVRHTGAHPLLVTQPSLYQEALSNEARDVLQFGPYLCVTPRGWLHKDYASARSLAWAMRAFNETTRQVARAEGAACADAAPRLEKTLAYFVDDVHHTPLGARTLARVIAATIIEARLIPTRQR